MRGRKGIFTFTLKGWERGRLGYTVRDKGILLLLLKVEEGYST